METKPRISISYSTRNNDLKAIQRVGGFLGTEIIKRMESTRSLPKLIAITLLEDGRGMQVHELSKEMARISCSIEFSLQSDSDSDKSINQMLLAVMFAILEYLDSSLKGQIVTIRKTIETNSYFTTPTIKRSPTSVRELQISYAYFISSIKYKMRVIENSITILEEIISIQYLKKKQRSKEWWNDLDLLVPFEFCGWANDSVFSIKIRGDLRKIDVSSS